MFTIPVCGLVGVVFLPRTRLQAARQAIVPTGRAAVTNHNGARTQQRIYIEPLNGLTAHGVACAVHRGEIHDYASCIPECRTRRSIPGLYDRPYDPEHGLASDALSCPTVRPTPRPDQAKPSGSCDTSALESPPGFRRCRDHEPRRHQRAPARSHPTVRRYGRFLPATARNTHGARRRCGPRTG